MNMLATIDLGGTHCRFARFAVTARGLALEAVETCPTARLQDGSAVLAQWESCLHTPLSQVAALVMGVAGPVQDGLRARLSNAPLRIDLNAAMPQFGLRRARVVNDFVCEACACLTRVGERSRHLLGPADIPCPSHRSSGGALAPVAVLGAGTGLGSGWLVPQMDNGLLRWSPLPSEAGHQAFAFLGREEEEFAAFARERLERPLLRPDDVVTGRGLAVLHQFLTGRELTPAGGSADPALVCPLSGADLCALGAVHVVLQWSVPHRRHGVAQSCRHGTSGFCGRFFHGSGAGGAGAHPCPPLCGRAQRTVGRGLAGGRPGRSAGREIAGSFIIETSASRRGKAGAKTRRRRSRDLRLLILCGTVVGLVTRESGRRACRIEEGSGGCGEASGLVWDGRGERSLSCHLTRWIFFYLTIV